MIWQQAKRAKEHRERASRDEAPPIVSEQESEAARRQLLLKEKAMTRSREALAHERRRMPWMVVEKKYEFDGPGVRFACSTCSRAAGR